MSVSLVKIPHEVVITVGLVPTCVTRCDSYNQAAALANLFIARLPRRIHHPRRVYVRTATTV